METQRPDVILNKLRAGGYEAYYVGGCVRDSLLGRPINDWDITTSAQPRQVMEIFNKCIPTGIRHGTVTVLEAGVRAEVTTFRTDGSYSDNRHPAQVTFVRSLQEDLARRDFTVNAMAMDVQGKVIDLYGGQKDLAEGILRCVGQADRRFREDALRMLRALRFSAQLGFRIEEETMAAIRRNAKRCEALSAERVCAETEKVLLSPRTERLEDMAKLGLLERCCPSKERSCAWLKDLPQDAVVRWAGLCRTWEQMELSVLRMSKKITQTAMKAGHCTVPQTRLEWKKLIAFEGKAVAETVAAMEQSSAQVEEILQSGECLSLRHLAVTGADLPDCTGQELGERLQGLLCHVLEHPEDNQKDILLSL